MNERPILFSGEMVRAILDGRKTQTRRVIKPDWFRCLDFEEQEDIAKAILQCPHGAAGDRLWVRETWSAVWPGEIEVPLRDCKIEYRADLPPGSTDYPGGWPAEDARGCDDAPKWRPSIFMPRWASRITLEIIRIRVERVQDISVVDTIAEGLDVLNPNSLAATSGLYKSLYEGLWNTINSKRGFGWDVNPWVWVIEFKMVKA